jgi:cystathionine beta-lyase/cystathionine gamma-synthase
MSRVNEIVVKLLSWLKSHPLVDTIYHPLLIPQYHWGSEVFKPSGDLLQSSNHPALKQREPSGFGGLFSLVLKDPELTSAPFYDALQISKGPSLGTNFSIACPYSMIAHYNELDWLESVGISRYLIRICIGQESAKDLIDRFAKALDIARQQVPANGQSG